MIHEQKEDAGTDHTTGLWSIGAGITLGWDSETGGSVYFDEDWDYQGYTVRQEFYGGAGGARVYSGYEWGFDGMEGRGAYGGARALGANVEFAQNGGWSYGGSYTKEYRFGSANFYHDLVATTNDENSAEYMGDVLADDLDNAIKQRIIAIRADELGRLTPDYINGETLMEFRVRIREHFFGSGRDVDVECTWAKSYKSNGTAIQKHPFYNRGGNVRAHTHPIGWLQAPSAFDQEHASQKHINYVYGEGGKGLYLYNNSGYQRVNGGF